MDLNIVAILREASSRRQPDIEGGAHKAPRRSIKDSPHRFSIALIVVEGVLPPSSLAPTPQAPLAIDPSSNPYKLERAQIKDELT